MMESEAWLLLAEFITEQPPERNIWLCNLITQDDMTGEGPYRSLGFASPLQTAMCRRIFLHMALLEAPHTGAWAYPEEQTQDEARSMKLLACLLLSEEAADEEQDTFNEETMP